jgi:hypothetical protein
MTSRTRSVIGGDCIGVSRGGRLLAEESSGALRESTGSITQCLLVACFTSGASETVSQQNLVGQIVVSALRTRLHFVEPIGSISGSKSLRQRRTVESHLADSPSLFLGDGIERLVDSTRFVTENTSITG